MNLLKFYRQILGIRQAELAEMVKTDQSEISRIETGKTKANPEKKKVISGALGLRPELVFPEDEIEK